MSLGKVLVTALLAVSACNKHGASSQAPGLEDFMDGTGAVRLGMTEDEVSRALGSRPAERNALGPPLVEAAWRMTRGDTFFIARCEQNVCRGVWIWPFVDGESGLLLRPLHPAPQRGLVDG